MWKTLLTKYVVPTLLPLLQDAIHQQIESRLQKREGAVNAALTVVLSELKDQKKVITALQETKKTETLPAEASIKRVPDAHLG